MFTGIIRHMGEVTRFTSEDKASQLSIASDMAAGVECGDSVAVNGACLTVLEVYPSTSLRANETMKFRLMDETLQRTSLGQLQVGRVVNLERPVAAGERFDGHFVMGHVDGVCEIKKLTQVGGDTIFTFQAPENLLVYMIEKGSISLNGVSLTIVNVNDDGTFTVSMMPYTLAHTMFGEAAVGDRINVEVDMIGKHVVRFLQTK